MDNINSHINVNLHYYSNEINPRFEHERLQNYTEISSYQLSSAYKNSSD